MRLLWILLVAPVLLVARRGGVFTFGSAEFRGSAGDIDLAAPVVGIANGNDEARYSLVATDRGVFTFGDARFHGSRWSRHDTARWTRPSSASISPGPTTATSSSTTVATY